MPKSLEEILASIQDPDARTAISEYGAKAARLAEIESQMSGKELVDRSTVDGWREFNTKRKPALEAELTRLRAEVPQLRTAAAEAEVLRKQIESGSGVVDPASLAPALRERLSADFLSAKDKDAIIKEAVEKATTQVNFGSLPMAIDIVESTAKARREYGLDINAGTFSEAVTRFGGVQQAYGALTADAARVKAEQQRAEQEAAQKAAIEAARQEGIRMGRQEADTRAYNPEEGGGSGTIPMVAPREGDGAGIDPTKYNPSDGVLARQAAAKLAKQEADGLWGNRLM